MSWGLKISDAALAKYWSHCKTFCSWARHPDLDGSHIPLTLYGDTARYGTGFDQSKVTGCFLSMVLWRPKSTRTSQWLLWSLDNELSLGWKSHNPLYFAIVQSLNAVFDGLTPEGTKLSNKYVVTQIKGDWEYHYHTWRLCRWWKTRWICWRCDAENHPRARHSMCDLSDNPSLGTDAAFPQLFRGAWYERKPRLCFCLHLFSIYCSYFAPRYSA